jgi:integrase
MDSTKLKTAQKDFPSLLESYFCDYLVKQRNASPETISSYRDTFRLFLQFMQQRFRKAPSSITLAELDAPHILAFLDTLETQRRCSIRTRNIRLAALRSFLHYAALQDPTALGSINRALAIPVKRFDRASVSYLSREVELGDADVDATATQGETRTPRLIGVNQLVWDPALRVLAAESDEQLRQHTRYAFVTTTGIRDSSGAPVGVAEELMRFRHDLNLGKTDNPVFKKYREELLDALTNLRKLAIPEEQVAGLSVFTTQSATAVLEHIRDKIKTATPEPANFLLGPAGSRTVFSLSSIQAIDWQQQIKVNPPAFQTFKPQFPGATNLLLLPDQYKPGAVGRIAYGSFRSPRYITDEPVMPPVSTRAGIPPVQQVETLYVNVFLPGGTPPPKGWPVVIFGLGGRDYKDEMPWLYAPAFASHGMATACINVAGEAYGPLSFIRVKLKDSSLVQFPAGGRGKDLNGDGAIDDNEGIATVSPAYRTLGPRDTIRQHIVELMQLVRVIEMGVDVDGDGVMDLDPSQIFYFGLSFGGGALGQLFMAIEPDVKVGVLASPAGMNSRFDLIRMRPAGRAQAGEALAARIPSLLNSPGLNSWGGVPVAGPFFNENTPLRNLPIVTNQVAGAMDI